MDALKDIQETTRATIAAGTFFAGWHIISEDGTKHDEIEAVLTSGPGRLVVVDPPHKGVTFREAPGSAIVMVTMDVSLIFNPKVNAAQPVVTNYAEAIAKLSATILAYGSESEEANRYEAADNFFQLVVTDEGLVHYLLSFQKLVSLSTEYTVEV